MNLNFENSKANVISYVKFYIHRCFSAIGLYITKIRTRLSSRMIEDLFILRGHFAEFEEERKKAKKKRNKTAKQN